MTPDKIEVIKKLRISQLLQQAYVDGLPREFQELLIDNEYANEQDKQKHVLIEALFPDYAEDVYWFLYEFEAGKTRGPHLRLPCGTEYTFHTDADYFKYLETL